MPQKAHTNRAVSRRRIMQAMGAAGAVGLAGCLGDDDPGVADDDDGITDDDDDDDDDVDVELGERFPDPFVQEYWSDQGGASSIKEAMGPIFIENMEAIFGVDVEYRPVEFTSQIDNIILDRRTHHLSSWWHTSTPDRLDPQEMTRRFSIDWAGGNGRANPAQYASCNFSHFSISQEAAPDDATREDLVTRAHEVMSHNSVAMPTIPRMFESAANPNGVELDGIGVAGMHATNPHWYIQSSPVDGDGWVVSSLPTESETTNFMVHDSSSVVALHSHLFHSTLTEYDENYQLQPVMAADFWFEDEGLTVGVELRDATFHDGAEITSDDVEWTFNHMWSNPGEFPHGTVPPEADWDFSIIDDKSLEFHLEAQWPSIVTREWPRWGILHSEHWISQGAEDSPGDIQLDPYIGSGPYEVVDFGFGEFIDATPHDGHPLFEPDGNLFFDAFRTEVTAVEAFLAGEIDAAHSLSPGGMATIEAGMPEAVLQRDPGFLPNIEYPESHIAPCSFEAVRKAIGMSFDRDLMLEVGLDLDPGDVDPLLFGTPFTPLHPFYPPEDDMYQLAPDGTGDIDGARQILQDAGFAYDDDGVLHYPSGADLTPIWAEDDVVPQPGDFDCITDIVDNLQVFEFQWDPIEALDDPLDDFIEVYGR